MYTDGLHDFKNHSEREYHNTAAILQSNELKYVIDVEPEDVIDWFAEIYFFNFLMLSLQIVFYKKKKKDVSTMFSLHLKCDPVNCSMRSNCCSRKLLY